MKSLMLLVETVLQDLGTRCRTSTTRDLKRIESRVEHEGISFLTISLPNFAKDLQKGLKQGSIDSSLFQGFSWREGLPEFLRGFLNLVFDSETGRLLVEPDVDAIYAVRQICLMFSKIELECTGKRTEESIRGYYECEQSVKEYDKRRSSDDYLSFRRMSMLLFGNVLQRVNNDIDEWKIVPKHGPGATVDRLRGNAKFDQTEWTTRLEKVFPAGEFLLPNWRYRHLLERVTFLEPGQERACKLTAVPKTLKTPRLIAIEPTCMQYVQQGISEKLTEYLEKGPDTLFPWLVGFADQGPNRLLAAEGSLDGTLATLDLSEASDRVSNQLVLEMTARFPSLLEGIQACRSRKVDVPGYGEIRLAKFASMGSALCFPIEAMVFATIIFLGIERELNRPLTLVDVHRLKGRVRVYGDDIIVPTEFVHSVVEALENFGFRVNHDKSFWTGKFRESCGEDYFDGWNITVTKLRRMIPTRREHVSELVSLSSFRNQMYYAGNWKTVRLVDDWISKIIPYPALSPTSPGIGKWSRLGSDDPTSFHTHLHKPLVKAMVVVSESPKSILDGEGALLKWFLKRGELPFADRDHLERAGRPSAVGIKQTRVPTD